MTEIFPQDFRDILYGTEPTTTEITITLNMDDVDLFTYLLKEGHDIIEQTMLAEALGLFEHSAGKKCRCKADHDIILSLNKRIRYAVGMLRRDQIIEYALDHPDLRDRILSDFGLIP